MLGLEANAKEGVLGLTTSSVVDTEGFAAEMVRGTNITGLPGTAFPRF